MPELKPTAALGGSDAAYTTNAGIPTAGFCVLRRIFATMSIRGVHMPLCNLLTLASLVLCAAVGLVLFFLSGRRAGFGYFVFINNGLSLKEINRYFRGFRRIPFPRDFRDRTQSFVPLQDAKNRMSYCPPYSA